jgi:flagellar hook-associated protein 1 FlgK
MHELRGRTRVNNGWLIALLSIIKISPVIFAGLLLWHDVCKPMNRILFKKDVNRTMPSVAALNSALSGLKIAQSNIGLLSSNIANVNTEGYTRKTQEQSTLIAGGQGQGVFAGVVDRAINSFIQRELFDQRAVAANFETKQLYFQQIQEFHGPAENQAAISNQLGQLKESFQALADDPSKEYLVNDVYLQASQTVDKMHQFSDLITRLRNDAQNEMQQIANSTNALSAQIADLNIQIKALANVNQSTATLEDQRDIAIAQIAEYVDISYYERTDKVVVVQTQIGTPLADDIAHTLEFNPTSIGPVTSYPNSVEAIRVDDPVTGVNLTDQATLGGKLGALIELRDTTLPSYQAQLDELAFRTAERMDSQGLRLFSYSDESLPLDNPNETKPLGYAGFAREITINPDIVANKDLIRSGTNGNIVSIGSSEQVRKIVDFAFSDVAYQQATSTFDLTATTNAGISGTQIINNYGALDTHPDITIGANDTFSIQIGAAPAVNIAITAGQTADDLVNTINASFPDLAALGPNGNLYLNADDTLAIADVNLCTAGLSALGLTAGTTNVATVDTLHNLLGIASRVQEVGDTDIAEMGALSSSDYINPVLGVGGNDTFSIQIGSGTPVDIEITTGASANTLVGIINTAHPGLAQLGPNGNLILTSLQSITVADVNLGVQGVEELGLKIGTIQPTDPSFTIQLGNREPVTIDITSTDTPSSFLAKINAIDGVEARTTIPDGFLEILPSEGGDIILTDGPSNPLAQMGVTVGNIAHTAFNTTNVGPNASVSETGISTSNNIIDYGVQIVSKQSQDAANVDSRIQTEQIYRDSLQKQIDDESGVNIDEEMAALVQIQNNYAAAAKAIQVIEELFQTLLSSVLR